MSELMACADHSIEIWVAICIDHLCLVWVESDRMRGLIIVSGCIRGVIKWLNIIQYGNLPQAIPTSPTKILIIKFQAIKHGQVKVFPDQVVGFAWDVFLAKNWRILMIFVCKDVILVRICSTLSLRIGPPRIDHLHRRTALTYWAGQTHQPILAVG